LNLWLPVAPLGVAPLGIAPLSGYPGQDASGWSHE